MIAVTGATGRLGQEIMRLLPDAIPIGRQISDEKYSVILHCAAPRANNRDAIKEFPEFNTELRRYADRHKPRIINVGSCWQILRGNSFQTKYAELKRQQSDLFPEATHIIPYWIYGHGRGFIYQLTQAILKQKELRTAGYWDRDFVCVTDVARDVIAAIEREPGMYASCSGLSTRPIELAQQYGIKAQPQEPFIWTLLDYPIPVLRYTQRTNLHEWIASVTQ